ncbi:MAG: MotA/TolQ/ExbB proton channel family protein [Candidatus Eisenbacteria bacterium]|nr:MotA/TolQ/ExbB proton channel family protein [Candidatus Eisenbacteria bacterium]
MEVIRTTFLYLKQGGWIMIPLAIASIVLWTMMMERFVYLRALRRQDLTIDDAIRAVRSGLPSVDGNGLRARLVRSFLRERSGFAALDIDILRRSAMREQPALGKSLAMIAVLVAVAPLLGLLGTVLGMIKTFQVISIFGTGNANAMAGGISIALITTEAGLLVAVPGLLLSGILMQQAARLRTQLEEDLTILTRIVRRPGTGECSRSDESKHAAACRGQENDQTAGLRTTSLAASGGN